MPSDTPGPPPMLDVFSPRLTLTAFMALASSASAAMGCGATTFECTVELASIRMDAAVIDDDDRVDAEVKLWALQRSGNEIPIALCQDEESDTLIVNGHDLAPIQTAGQIVYRARLDEARRRYRFEIYRSEEDAKATLEIVSPQSFVIDPNVTQVSRETPVAIQWDPPAPDSEITVTVEREDLSCIARYEGVVPDSGSATFAAPWPAPTADTLPDAECEAQLSLVRRADAPPTELLREGTSASVFVQRRLRFLSVP